MVKKLLIAFIAVLASTLAATAANPELYLRGEWTNDSWAATENNKMKESNGVYTITVPTLSGKFKIADAKWEYNVSTGNTYMSLGKVYNCGSGENMGVTGTFTNATVTYYYEKQLVLITDNTHQLKLYLSGENFGKWEYDEQYKMTENNGIYTITVPTLSGEFKIFNGKWYVDTEKIAGEENGIDFGTGEESMVTGKPYTSYVEGGNMKMTNPVENATVTFNMTNNVVTVTKGIAEDFTGMSDKVKFIGTATCEFSYQDATMGHQLWLRDKNGNALQFSMSEMDAAGNEAAGFELDIMAPYNFNRGNTITEFTAEKGDNGVYVITEFTLIDAERDGKDVRAPKVGPATDVEIPDVTNEGITENMLNRMVQVKGEYTYNGDTKQIIVNNNTYKLVNNFTHALETPSEGGTSAPMMAEGTTEPEWKYGVKDIPSLNGAERYVSGIVTKIDGNFAIDMTAISEGIIAGVEGTEVDAESIVNVYNMQGMVVRRAVKYGEALRDLPAGLYIVAGKKVIVR